MFQGGCHARCPGTLQEGGTFGFPDIEIDPITDRVWPAFVDVCTLGCDELGATAETPTRSHGAVGKQVGRTFLLTAPRTPP